MTGGVLVLIILVSLLIVWKAQSLTYVATLSEEVDEFVQSVNLFSSERVPLSPIVRTEQRITLPDGTETTIELAEPFTLTVAAEGLGKIRFMTMSPDGRVFVPDIVDYNLSHEGKLYILSDFDEATGTFGSTSVYLDNLRGPNSVAFYTDISGTTWLYLALTEHLLRYTYEAGDVAPRGDPEVVTTFPNEQAPGEMSVVWHITRTILFHNDRLYVAIGSGCNSCEDPYNLERGMIRVMDPDGSNASVYADGLRNAVGLEWAEGALYATANGVDHLGIDRPDERMYRIEEGAHYRWPYCYEVDGDTYPVITSVWNDPLPCEDAPRSLASFEPRSAPLGVTYFNNAHPMLQGSFLVALHGSFDPSLRRGYEVVRVTPDGVQEVFMTSLQNDAHEAALRPVHFLKYDENSFFMTDDHYGRIYFVRADI